MSLNVFTRISARTSFLLLQNRMMSPLIADVSSVLHFFRSLFDLLDSEEKEKTQLHASDSFDTRAIPYYRKMIRESESALIMIT